MLLDSLRQPGWREIQIDGVSKKGQENQAVRIFGNDNEYLRTIGISSQSAFHDSELN
jgi:hypothetical protein